MTIAQVSKLYGLSADTLRYYERVGLIPDVRRSESGIRNYSEADCRWIEFIKCLRAAGLPIEALIEYVALAQAGESTQNERMNLLMRERVKLAERIAEQQKTLKHLDEKIAFYQNSMKDVQK